jgi:hypothetical protein
MLSENRERIINEYTALLERKLRENVEKIPEEIFGADGHVIHWLGQELARNNAPAIKRTGQRIKRDLVYYELSL